jgi:hypothetical protein
MSELSALLDRVRLSGPIPVSGTSRPLGAAFLPAEGAGIDLAAHGYVEEEYLLDGEADAWSWDAGYRAVSQGAQPVRTRLVVRRPADPGHASGVIQLEPHHPDDDRALSWSALAPYLLRVGDVHVGVSQDPGAIEDLRHFDPERYGALAMADPTQRYDLLALVAALARHGRLPGLGAIRHVIGSGWSMTGTFWRGFLGEGFHERATLAGIPVIDAYVICISSGGAARAGYPSLSEGRTLPLEDGRRRVHGHGAIAVELLSEGESETHARVLRPDSDAAADQYRLYQVAGSAHVASGIPQLLTNRLQLVAAGWPQESREILEERSDARMDLVARAVVALVAAWCDGVIPPSAARFGYDDPAGDAPRGTMPESIPLQRDADGNVIGGIRSPWVDVPLATYLPHSTPHPGSCLPSPHAPYRDPALLADLIGHRVPFRPAELRRRYVSPEGYLERFRASCATLVAAGYLLAEDVPELETTAARAKF